MAGVTPAVACPAPAALTSAPGPPELWLHWAACEAPGASTRLSSGPRQGGCHGGWQAAHHGWLLQAQSATDEAQTRWYVNFNKQIPANFVTLSY